MASQGEALSTVVPAHVSAACHTLRHAILAGKGDTDSELVIREWLENEGEDEFFAEWDDTLVINLDKFAALGHGSYCFDDLSASDFTGSEVDDLSDEDRIECALWQLKESEGGDAWGAVHFFYLDNSKLSPLLAYVSHPVGQMDFDNQFIGAFKNKGEAMRKLESRSFFSMGAIQKNPTCVLSFWVE